MYVNFCILQVYIISTHGAYSKCVKYYKVQQGCVSYDNKKFQKRNFHLPGIGGNVSHFLMYNFKHINKKRKNIAIREVVHHPIQVHGTIRWEPGVSILYGTLHRPSEDKGSTAEGVSLFCTQTLTTQVAAIYDGNKSFSIPSHHTWVLFRVPRQCRTQKPKREPGGTPYAEFFQHDQLYQSLRPWKS